MPTPQCFGRKYRKAWESQERKSPEAKHPLQSAIQLKIEGRGPFLDMILTVDASSLSLLLLSLVWVNRFTFGVSSGIVDYDGHNSDEPFLCLHLCLFLHLLKR